MSTTHNHLLLIAHAPLAHALRDCAVHVFADCGGSISVLDVQPDMCPEETLQAAQQLLHTSGAARTLVLSDVFGATPCNVAQRLVEGTPARLLVGVNVPMLLRAISYLNEPLDALVQRAFSGGQQGVLQVGSSQALRNQSVRSDHAQDTDHHQQ